MRKIRNIVLIIISSILIICPGVVYASSANTLGELKKELTNLKNQKSSANANKNKTQSEINSAKNTISAKHSEILQNQEIIIAAQNESDALSREIEEGKGELANLLLYSQITGSENAFFDYIFSSNDYEELIHRSSIAEQIMNYQNTKIIEWQNKIAYNNQLKIDLQAKETELNNQIDALNKDVKKLGTSLAELNDMVLDIDAEIKSVQGSISYYESIGCKDNQTLSECLKVYGDTKFRLPTKKGTITDNFGYRVHPITGKAQSFHTGTDIGIAEGSNVYAIANGTVSKLTVKSSCGGNMIYIQHIINGKKYTSTYMHLLQFKVKVGDVVTNETVIALSGGGSTGYKKGGYDTCTTGAHLHLSIATDWYGVDYLTYNQWVSHLIDAGKTIPIPRSWSSR